MKTEKNAPYVSYMGFLMNSYSIQGFFDIVKLVVFDNQQIINEDYIPFSRPHAQLTSLLHYLDHQKYARNVVLDLISLLQLASANLHLPLQIPNLVTISIPLIRVMASTPVLRYIDSRALHVVDSPQVYQPHSRTELEDIVEEMQRLGVVSRDSDQFIDSLSQFEKLGGRILFFSSKHKIPPISILPSDTILSICHEGWNRSQVLCEAIHAVQRAQAMNPEMCDLPVSYWMHE